MARYFSDGVLDFNFNGSGKVINSFGFNSVANSVKVQSDGKIVLAGSSDGLFALARFNDNGSPDMTFNGTGTTTTTVGYNGQAYGMALQTDGKIVVAGYAFNDTTPFVFVLARYNSNGTLDTSFNGTGIATNTIAGSDINAFGVALQSDGKIVTIGDGFVGGAFSFIVTRNNTNGTLDTTFSNGIGRVTTPIGGGETRARSVAIQNDGKIVVAGYSQIAGVFQFATVRYNTDGTLDTTFNGTGKAVTPLATGASIAFGVALQSDGKIVVAGEAANSDDFSHFAVARYAAPNSPFITLQPTNRTVLAGSNVLFATAAIGTAPLRYQWRTNNTVIANATNATFTVTNAQSASAASYTVVVTNDYGRATSSVAVLTVNVPATITNQPVDQSVIIGSNAMFTVGATGTGILRYQWRTNNVNVSNATNSAYTVSNAQPANAVSYTVVVTNSFGATTSSVATLTVNIPPSITNQPASQSVIQGGDATFSVGAGGTAPLFYQWRTNDIDIVGATDSIYTVTGAQQENAASYTIVVANDFGSITSSVATLTVNFAPIITTQPTNQIVLAGSNVTFAVSADGTAPLLYQWRTNNINIPNATNSIYTVTNAQDANAASYTVVVTNDYGSDTSSVAELTVNVPPFITTQPTNQTVNMGSNATFVVGAGGTAPLFYQWRTNNIHISNATNSAYSITNLQRANAASYTVVVTNSFGNVTSSIARLTVNFAPIITFQPQSRTVPPGSFVGIPSGATAVPSPKFQWRTNGINAIGQTNQGFPISNFQAANEAGYDVVVTNILGAVTSATAFVYLDSPLRFTNQKRASNSFSVLLLGVVNTNYVIDVATNLDGWTPVVTNSSANGIITFGETNVLPQGNRLFRARWQ